ncbi:MAG: methyltransferase domain-containing protein [Chloroflexi bacterium]|nr:methyltransferase domain-containing protein [Chloroflexota bacterium]
MSSSPWNPDQYHKFRNERSQPFFDLLALVQPIPGGRAVDLGCGTGELTKLLHEHTGARSTTGVDNSETMLERTAGFAGKGLRFKLGTILRFAPRSPLDLVFSNAALQWVPDHERLFDRLAAGLGEGGQLAVQMPANHDHPSHITAFALAGEEPFFSEMQGYRRQWPVMPPEWYAERLDRLGFREQSVRLQVYGHHLGSRDDVIEWVKGTLLTDYQQRMAPPVYEQFLARYREALLPQLADARPYFYGFKRILIWGRR